MLIIRFFLLTIILLFIFAVSVLFLMTRNRRIKTWVLSVLSVIAVFGGFSFYLFSYLSSNAGFADILIASLRGIFSTARMFIINADYNSLQASTNNLFLRVLFWICHVSALIVVQAALLTLFGRRLMESLRLRIGLHNEVYIIKGNDKYALLLGENIATHDNPQNSPDGKRLIILLISEEDDAKNYEKAIHFGGIVRILDKKKNLTYYMNKSGFRNHDIRRIKYNVVLMPNNASTPDDVFLVTKYAEEEKIKNMELNIFVLTSSEWDREQIEFFTQKEGHKPYSLHIINETDLLIRQMIEKHPPFKCPKLDFNELGIAKRCFNIMILGFGTVGQQALLRLIMNGQFVTDGNKRMCAIVADREIKHLEEHFRHCHPSIDLCCELKFWDCDVRDKVFYNTLNEYNDLDYIVVSLNSNDENKKVAMDLYLNYKRKGMPIPFIAVSEKNKRIHEFNHYDEIFTFGCDDEIYRESVIIREETNRMAKVVNEIYKGKPWYELDCFLQESNRAAADFIPAMLKLASLTVEEAENKEKLTDNDDHADILAKTEHLRWVAFHAVMGYSPINIDEMRQRYESSNDEKNIRARLDYCRRDTKTRLHACLAHWDELDNISQAYNDLAYQAGDEKEKNRDFKENDRDIIKYIPLFLNASKKEK